MQLLFFHPKVSMRPADNMGNVLRLKEGKCHGQLLSDGDFPPCINWRCSVEAMVATQASTRACTSRAGCARSCAEAALGDGLPKEMSQKRLTESEGIILGSSHILRPVPTNSRGVGLLEGCHVLTVSQSRGSPSLGYSKVCLFFSAI